MLDKETLSTRNDENGKNVSVGYGEVSLLAKCDLEVWAVAPRSTIYGRVYILNSERLRSKSRKIQIDEDPN